MPPFRPPPAGFSLVELIIVLLIVAILSTFAFPSFQQAISGIRARSALNRVTVELYRARMLAIDTGFPIRLEIESDARRCTSALRVIRTDSSGRQEELPPVRFDLADLCLRHTGGRTIYFDGRGMLRPPSRSFSVVFGSASERVLISIAGRIRRTY